MSLALTVRQPFAGLIVSGAKRIENRPRRSQVTGTILIHAGAQLHDRRRDLVRDSTPLAAFVGTVTQQGSHRAGSRGCDEHGCYAHEWAEWPAPGETLWHLVLGDPLEFVTPIPAKGALGYWRPLPTAEHLIHLAIREATERGEHR